MSSLYAFSNVFNLIKNSFKINVDDDIIEFEDVKFNFLKLYENVNEFVPKIKNEDIFFNTKFYLKKSLQQLTLTIDEEKNEEENGKIKIKNLESNFFEISKNGGLESKKEIVNFLTNIAKIYDKDMDLILKKIEVFSKLEIKELGNYLDVYLEKFLDMVQKNSDTLLN